MKNPPHPGRSIEDACLDPLVRNVYSESLRHFIPQDCVVISA
ncbi:MAG: hypothetical protein ACE5GV_16675 [Candidatus Scalindua sp.]